MKILTIATKSEGYFELLIQTGEKFGYDIKALGWEMPWKGFAWKLELYISELERIDEREPIVCVDGFDVVAVGSAAEMKSKFLNMNHAVIFSGQRYFPRQKCIQSVADKLMSNSKKQTIGNSKNPIDYSRPCMGLLAGYAGNLLVLFKELLKIEEKEKIGNDQILLNIYYLRNPTSIGIDVHCALFQNLWRTKSGLYGKFSLQNKSSEIVVVKQGKQYRILNRHFNTTPCFLHAPFNLDIGSVLTQLNLKGQIIRFGRGWNYSNYSLLYYIKRGFKFFWKEIVVALLVMLLIAFLFRFEAYR